MNNLKGKTALITGASRGIGRASALARAQAGAQVLVHYSSSEKEADAVAPGVVGTDMSDFTKTDAGREYTLGMQALKRLAQPDDIAPVVAFLASDDARWVTGQSIHVDGGSKL
jgi:3-oxoacyl-[acyl-carrier protein] reductase